jgi:hypothetical protein
VENLVGTAAYPVVPSNSDISKHLYGRSWQ